MNHKYKIAILILFVGVNLVLFFYGQTPSHREYKNQPSPEDLSKELNSYYILGQSFKDNQNNKATVSFLAVGDIMLSRNVAKAIKESGDVNLPFSQMSNILKSTDFNFGNLETPVASSPLSSPSGGGQGGGAIIGGHSLVFNSPKEYVSPLKDYNFKIMTLANNHALDQGSLGLAYTSQFLDELNIKHIGAGKNLDEAWQHQIIEREGIKICFIGASYASINDNGKTTNAYVARMEDVEKLKSAIRNSKIDCNFIIATMHAGTEYVRKPNKLQTDFAHAAVDAGADMVIGHHPHWIQTIERYAPNCPSPILGEGAPTSEGQERLKCGEPKYIFYSLGNFIFDQMWSQETREGLTLKITISKNKESELQGSKLDAKLESVELLPVIIDNYSTPRPANPDEAKKILEKIGQTENILK